MAKLHTVKTNIAARSLSSNPELDRLNVVGGAAVAAAGGDIKLVGRNLLQSQTFDSLNITAAGGADITIFALAPGVSGIIMTMVATGAGPLVFFDPNTKGLILDVGLAGRTSDQLATLINANAAATDGYVRATSAGGAFSFTLAQGPTPLAGGVGDWAANQIFVGGLAALPANETGINAVAKWSNTGIICTTQAVGAATDVAAIAVRVDGVWTGPLSAVLV
jgi:hypothetical protein